jgi:hypothetical protein
VLSAIDRGEQVGEGLVDPESTLLAAAEIRDLLTELTGVRFQSPTLRKRGLSSLIVDGIRTTKGRLVRRWRGFGAGSEVPLDELHPREAAVFTGVRAAMSPVDVQLCEGGGPAGRTLRGVVVPRSGSAMTAGAELVNEDPVWLYPLLLALDTGGEPSIELRESWLAASQGKLIQITPSGERLMRQ